MEAAEFVAALNVPAALADMERPFTTRKADGVEVDWMAMRLRLGQEGWRGYIRLRQAVRDAARPRAA